MEAIRFPRRRSSVPELEAPSAFAVMWIERWWSVCGVLKRRKLMEAAMVLGRLVLVIVSMSAPAFGQTQWTPPRTSDGAPSLEGMWTNVTATPLERPAAFDAPTTTEEQAKAFVASSNQAFLDDNSDGIGGRQSEWWEVGSDLLRINGEIRTSVIVEPSNGRMPYSAEGQARLAKARNDMLGVFDHPEARPSPERCLTGGSGTTGVPMFTARYNGHYEFVQTKDHLVIAMEQNGVTRIIPLHTEPRSAPRRWMGHSVGRWEGETLVVVTEGFTAGDQYKPASAIYVSDDAKVTERFTRISSTEILYQYAVEDPVAFTQTWRGEQLFYAATTRPFETACHEGNYSLPGILAGGREIDRRRARAGK
jgi:hypothetical protein